MLIPSVAVVEESCSAACKALRQQCKQLLILSSSYAKLPVDNAGADILEVLSITIKSVNAIQDSLTRAAISIKADIDTDTPDDEEHTVFPDKIVVTAKEYAFLNAVFKEYTRIVVSSQDFSLFCTPSDICGVARHSCQENAEISKGKLELYQNPLLTKK